MATGHWFTGTAVARELVQRALSAELGSSTNEVLTSNTTKVFSGAVFICLPCGSNN